MTGIEKAGLIIGPASWIPLLILALTGYGQGGGGIPAMGPIILSLGLIVFGNVAGVIVSLIFMVARHRRRERASGWAIISLTYYALIVCALVLIGLESMK